MDNNLIIGSHVSFKNNEQMLGSVKEAISYGSNAFMFYTGAPQNTNRLPLNDNLTIEAYKLMKENNIMLENVIVHAPYIVNLANSNNFQFSVRFLTEEVERCEQLGVKYLVLHPGSAIGVSRDEAIDNIARGLNLILENNNKVTILLETMAGKGNEIGRTFEELANIIKQVKSNQIGVCLDTCHISDAGYDISNFDNILNDFDKIIGIKYLKCLHINDSKNPSGASKDRHENFGLGYLGFNNLINIVYNNKISNIPKILETPYLTINDSSKERIYPPYKFEIKMIKEKIMNTNLINDIRKYYGEKNEK